MAGQDVAALRQAAGIREEVERHRSEFGAWVQEREDYLQSLADDPPKLDLAGADIKLAKKRRLLDQLRHKLEDIRATAMERQINDFNVPELGDALERQWTERQKAEDAYERRMDKMDALHIWLHQKAKAVEVLREAYPRDWPHDARPGIDHLNFVYNTLMAQNRAVSAQIQQLTPELKQLQAENAELVRAEES
jgi:hypothetical protein